MTGGGAEFPPGIASSEPRFASRAGTFSKCWIFGPFFRCKVIAAEPFLDVMSAAEVAILARIVAAVEAGEALPVEEAALVDRLRKTAPRPAPRRWREERAALIVDYAYRFARDAHSVRAKAVRLIAELNRFCNGEWQHLQHRVECPFPASDRRAVLWMLLKLGPPPGLTVIREALTESLARIPATA